MDAGVLAATVNERKTDGPLSRIRSAARGSQNSPHRHMRHGDGRPGRHAQGSRLQRHRLRPKSVSAHERLPGLQGDIDLQRLRPGESGCPSRPGHRRQRRFKGQPRSHGHAGKQTALLLHAPGRPCLRCCGQAPGRRYRHPRKDHHILIHRLAAKDSGSGSFLSHRGHRFQLQQQLPGGQGGLDRA